jgi:hypothetical protein
MESTDWGRRFPLLRPFLGTSARTIALDFLLIFLYTAMLLRPYFRANYEDKWASIESTFIADARFLAEHWPHPNWQPLWYAGTRFDYIYPPALRYGSAAISKITGFLPARSYHIYCSILYALGIAAIYLLIRLGSKSRACAWLGAIATSLMSPVFLFMPRYRGDAWMLQPQRLGVLVKYGEGPHMSALALIPMALAFTWLALEKRRPWAIAVAALFSAAVAANNFYGATALAIFYPLMVWSFWITRQEKRIVAPAIAIPILSYGLCAFWLVPSYFKVTAENMKYVSEHGTTWSIWVAVIVAVAFALCTDKLARARKQHTWSVFVAGCVVFFTVNVLGNYYFNFRVAGEPMRLLPELDMIYIIAVVLLLKWMWDRPGIALRGVAIVIVLAAFYSAKGYIRHAWHMFPTEPHYTSRVEYRVTDWLWKNMPDARAYPTGSVRFWYDTWHDLAQVGGGSEQGLLNPEVEPAQWETNLGSKPEPTILWMQSLGVDAVYVSDKRSQEVFKDFHHPEKLAGLLPVIFDDQQGNILYRIPRRYTVRARVVETARLNAAHTPRFNDDTESLAPYVDVIEKGPDSPVTLTRESTDAMRLRAHIEPGQSLVVQETYDPSWQATVEGKSLPVRKDAVDFIVLDPPPGDREIRLEFTTPLENQVGRVASALTLALLLSLVAFRMRWEPLM